MFGGGHRIVELTKLTVMAKDTIIIPEGRKEIKDFEFAGHPELRHVVIPDSVERIGVGAFNDSGVEELVFPASLREIGDLSDLKRADMSRCVHIREILSPGFYRGGSDGVVILPPNIGRIGDRCFNRLDSLYAPETLSEVGEMEMTGLFCLSPSLKSLRGMKRCILHPLEAHADRYREQMRREGISESVFDIDPMPYYLAYMYKK